MTRLLAEPSTSEVRSSRSRHRSRGVLAAAAAAAAALTACGGGGSDPAPGGGGGTTNVAPTISGTPETLARVGTRYRFAPTAADADGDTLRFSATGLPGWAVIDENTGIVSGSPVRADLASTAGIVVSVSDGTHTTSLPAFKLTVAPPRLNETQMVVNGTRTSSPPTGGGTKAFEIAGDVDLTPCGFTTRMKNANLHTEFDEDGNLADLYGLTDLPGALSDYLFLGPNVKAQVGLYKGSQINADPDLGITLQPEFTYFVYHLNVETELQVGDRKNPGKYNTVTLSLPLGQQTVFITDVCDVMVYRYHGSPAGSVGYGESDHGLIPFVPNQDWKQLDTFDGHRIEKGVFGLGIKVFDVLEITGTRVTRDPQFNDIDWGDPLASKIEYKTGLNGDARFALGVLGVGIFDFDAAKASATLDVGFDRQHMAMQATIAPDVSWQPNWFPILPSTEIVGNWVVDGKGVFEATLKGEYRSTLPEGRMIGTMTLDPSGVRMVAAIPDDKFPLSIEASFLNLKTTVQINTPKVDLGFGVQEAVKASLDRELVKLQKSIDDLKSAVADYEFEASLRGLRSALPGIVDTAVTVIDAVPGKVRTSVDNGVVNALRTSCKDLLFDTVCASDFVNETSIGDTYGGFAKTIADQAIKTPRANLLELKRIAQLGDDASLRQALEDALYAVYDVRTIKVVVPKYTYTIDWPSPIPNSSITIYSGTTLTYTILDAATASQVLTAAQNAYRIQQTSDLRISAQQIVDAIPTEAILNKARSDVDKGLALIPSFDGAGYEVSATELSYTPYLILSGERHGVTFNLLDPVAMLEGIGDTIAGLLTK